MSLYGALKHADAMGLAEAEGFEWDYEDEDREEELYECLEILGYTWTGEYWDAPEESPS